MDNFAYHYTTIGSDPSNRLDYVNDSGTNDGVGGDILTGMATGNYDYDKLGQLLSNVQEGIGEMIWRKGDKKLKKIERDDQASAEVEFVYSPFGLRVLKIERPRVLGVVVPEEQWKYTYYAYDVNGQVMANYAVTMSSTDNVATWSESNIYGASRIGQLQTDKVIWDNGAVTPTESDVAQNLEGDRRYEVTNHLGNVLAVVTDRHEWNATDSWYEPVVVMTSDYYPFGMVMPGRSSNVGDYRYAYNGMEQDNEVSGNGNSYTTEFRQYDPRLGRWKSLDPLMAQFPWMRPYVAFDNNPVYFVDPLGLKGGPAQPVGAPSDPTKGSTYTDKGGQEWMFSTGDNLWHKVMVGGESTVLSRKNQVIKENPVFTDGAHRPGVGQDITSGRKSWDYIYKTTGAVKGTTMRIQLDQLRGESQKELFRRFRNLGYDFSEGYQSEAMVQRLISHFQYGNGEMYDDWYLKKLASKHASYIRFKKKVIETFDKKIDQNGGWIDAEMNLDALDYNRPCFCEDPYYYASPNGDSDNGLRISVNDVHSYKIVVVNYKQIGNQYEATIKIVLYDHFGLDESDMSKLYKYYSAGFTAWWILQMHYGYKPFINRMIMPSFTIKGTIDGP